MAVPVAERSVARSSPSRRGRTRNLCASSSSRMTARDGARATSANLCSRNVSAHVAAAARAALCEAQALCSTSEAEVTGESGGRAYGAPFGVGVGVEVETDGAGGTRVSVSLADAAIGHAHVLLGGETRRNETRH